VLAHLPKGAKLFAVVKANGYGHGSVQVARAALTGGAWGLAVATLEEAHELTRLVRADRVLVMGGLTAQHAAAAAASGCAIAVSSLEFAQALGDRDEVVPVHLKIDTGMGRFGCAPHEAAAIAKFVDEAPSLLLAGTWTHFASADSDEAMTRKQFDRFIDALTTFEVDPGLRHACNSAGAHRFPEWPGTKPVLAVRSVVTHLRTLAAGDTVGYGATWRAVGRTPVATVAIGYADGVNRARSNRGHVLIRGHRAPVIGAVSMDAVTVEAANVPGIKVGDVVTVVGEDQGDRITAEEVAEWSNTIPYEVLTSVGPRVERRYLE
jgi:alanine racemase